MQCEKCVCFALIIVFNFYRPLSRNAETKDFARPTSHPVRVWTGKNKAFCSPGTQNGRQVIKVYAFVLIADLCFVLFVFEYVMFSN